MTETTASRQPGERPPAMAQPPPPLNLLRQLVARREISDALQLPDEQLDLHAHATFSYTLFPNAIIVFQPDYPSILRLYPQGPDDTLFVHTMLTPGELATVEERDHFERSFALIDGAVFRGEDLFVCEGAQRGFRSNANDSLLFGALEEAAAQFHDTIEAALAED